MRITSHRLGHVLGFIFANLVSPSWLIMPLCFGALSKVTHVDIQSAFTHPDELMLVSLRLHDAILANPLPVFTVLIACFLLMSGVGLAYTVLVARLGGHLATNIEKAWEDGAFSLSLFSGLGSNKTVASLD
jgi:hypothetical protein